MRIPLPASLRKRWVSLAQPARTAAALPDWSALKSRYLRSAACGAWMYPREAIPRMIAMARAGLSDLSQFSAMEFPLAHANEAVAHAAANGGPLRMTAETGVRP